MQALADFKEMEARHEVGVYQKRDVLIVRGEGALVWDSQGREYIDCVAGHGCANVGHCNPRVAAAIERQSRTLITCPEIFHNDRRAELLGRLAGLSGLPRAFLSNSGTESIEAAFKFARASTGRKGIVAFMQGFHGRTMGALSATWKKEYREPFEPLVPGFSHLPYNSTEGLAEGITRETAAVVLEVVQGEGGVRPATGEFLRQVRERCDETGALLIIDEVQTGIGRTGKLFAFEHHPVRPDICCIAKSLGGGVPIGATLCSEGLTVPKSSHGSTFGGNPLAAAAALAVLDFIEEEGSLAQACESGRYLMEKLTCLDSGRIREVRGLGLMLGIELKEKATPFITRLMEEGVLALPAGPTVIRLLPPLVISCGQIDRVCDALGSVLA